MADKPMTATEVMMLDHEGRRLEMRDRQVAMAVASKVVEERFDPAAIEDMRDVRRQLIEAAEFAAYEAIQKERELHIGGMTMPDAQPEQMEQRMQAMKNYAPDASPSPMTTGEHHTASISAADRFKVANARIEEIISAWAFAHNIDGAARNDLFDRLRTTRPTPDLGDDGELVERLRDEATALERAAWSRPDGGQDACIAANLANEAADRLILYREARDRVEKLVAMLPNCALRNEALDILRAVLSSSRE